MPRTLFVAMSLLALAGLLIACSNKKSGTSAGNTPGLTPSRSAVVLCKSVVLATPDVTPPVPTSGPPPAVSALPTTTASGLQIIDVTVGDGAEAMPGACVVMNYTGWLADGTVFDSSAIEGGPIQASLNNLVKGWREGVPGMKVGGTRRLIVPPDLAYGASGNPPAIPPNATLTFDLELLDIAK